MTTLIRTALFGMLAGVLGWFLVQYAPCKSEPEPIVIPVPAPTPAPRRPLLPRQEFAAASSDAVGKISTGGPIAPDGKSQVVCDLPVDQRKHNVGGRDGAGLCVFTSIMHEARWQNERRLMNFQDDMRKEPGGGYPEKVDRMIAKFGAGTPYLQYEGRDPSILELALRTGRFPAVTYDGHDGVHYHGRIAHMVNLAYLDETWACILDNNFIGENELVWMSRSEFLQRWTGGGSGWAVVLLSPPPPPVPHN
jgi:hypothetical protein